MHGAVVDRKHASDRVGHWLGEVDRARGQLRDSDAFVGYDTVTIEAQLTNGSASATSAIAGAFGRRAGRDVVTGTGLAADTIVRTIAGDTVTLSAPWTGPTGKALLAFHHDQHNYCVHFAEDVP